MRAQQVELKGIPATFGSDREQEGGIPVRARALTNGGTDRGRPGRIGHESRARADEAVEIILDEDLEPPMDGDHRQMSVAGLLEAFDEKWAVALGSQDVRIEIRTLDPLGVGEHDASDPESGELGPKPAHDLGAGQGEQNVDARSKRRRVFEDTCEFHHPVA